MDQQDHNGQGEGSGAPRRSLLGFVALERKHWPVAGLLLVMILGLSGMGLKLFERWQTTRSYSFQIDAEEGFILDQAMELARGHGIYPSFNGPPYKVGNYPPALPWVYSWLNGPQADVHSLARGRTLVQMCTLLAALGLGGIILLRWRRLLPALLTPLLFLVTYEVHHWSAFVRVDLPALMLTVAGVGAFLLIRPVWGMVVAAVFFVFAAYTRQTAVLAPLACVLVLAGGRQWRRLGWLAGSGAGLGLLIFLVLQWQTEGEFWRHVVTYNRNQMDWAVWRVLMRNEVWFFYRWWIMAALAGVGVACGGLCLHARQMKAEVPEASRYTVGFTCLWAFLAALSLLSYAKVGAAPNYVLEPLAALALWTGDLLGRLMVLLTPGAPWPARTRRWAAAGLWLVSLLLGGHVFYISQGGVSQAMFSSRGPTPYDRAVAGELMQRVRATEGRVYCEEPIFTLLARREVLFQPFIMSQLAKEGLWNDRPFVRMLVNKSFALLVVTEDLRGAGPFERYTQPMAEAIREHYRLTGQAVSPGLGKTYYLWEPAPSGHESQGPAAGAGKNLPPQGN